MIMEVTDLSQLRFAKNALRNVSGLPLKIYPELTLLSGHQDDPILFLLQENIM